MQEIEFVFFDIRDTLGYIDRPGHLVPYRPTTDRLLETVKGAIGLKIGIITNLPGSVTADQGRKLLDDAGITSYLEPAGIIINHDAGSSKPGAAIFEYAAEQVGIEIGKCCFVGENLIEVIGAKAAGMQAMLKPYPQGGEFKLQAEVADPATPTNSGRLFERVLEDEHVFAKRITIAAAKLAAAIREQAGLPLRAMGLLTMIVNDYVDPYHHRKEEKVLLPMALARGMTPDVCDWVKRQHEQGRCYFRAMSLALERTQAGEASAAPEFADICDAFAKLYRDHGPKEDNDLCPKICEYLSDLDDAVIVELINEIGPPRPNPWIALVGELERELGS